MKSVLPFLLGLALFSSCDQDVGSIPKAEAQAAQEELRNRIADSVGTIESLESELEKLSADKDVLVSVNDHLIVMITSRIEELQSESLSANETLSKIREGVEALKRDEAERQLRRARGEDVTLFCGNGPWDKWPKMTEDAKTTIARNAAAEIELQKVLEVLKLVPKRATIGEQAGDGDGE